MLAAFVRFIVALFARKQRTSVLILPPPPNAWCHYCDVGLYSRGADRTIKCGQCHREWPRVEA